MLGADAVDEFARGTQFSTGLGDAWRVLVGVVIPPFLVFTLFVGLGDVAGLSLPTWQVAVAAVLVAAAVVGVAVGTRRHVQAAG